MNRDRFKKCFYRLVLFRHLVEQKSHKEEIIIYKAFSKLVANSCPKQRVSTAEINGVRVNRILSPNDHKLEEIFTVDPIEKSLDDVETEIEQFDAEAFLQNQELSGDLKSGDKILTALVNAQQKNKAERLENLAVFK